ncbi:hypothetical protein HDV05_003461 [Chytridiales sp. JEL 0842]|nr:hypothetical protein HDV05_003461 [Chytridiales sp. JEL 0842]
MSTLDEFRSKKIRVFRNGDTHNSGKKFVVSTRVYRNFEQFLHNISEDLELNGAVRKIYTIEGAVVQSLENLEDGGFYVASSGADFKRVPYSVLSNNGDQTDAYVSDAAETQTIRLRTTRRKRMQVANEHENRVKEKPLFGPASKAYRVMIFANGESTSPGQRLVLNYRNCQSFDQFLVNLSNLLRLKTGFVRKLYDAETGKRIKCLADLKDGQNIVAGSGEPLKHLGKYQLANPCINQFDIKKEDDTPHVVKFFPNGDGYHHGYNLTIRKSRYNNLKKVIDVLNNVIELVTGRITRIHTMDGTRIDTVDQLFAARSFVVCTADDVFYHIKYDVNSIKPRPILGLAGSTKTNAFMSKIRKAKTGPPLPDPYATDNEHTKPTTAKSRKTRKSESIMDDKPKTANNDEKQASKSASNKKKGNKKAVIVDPAATDAEAEADTEEITSGSRKSRTKSAKQARTEPGSASATARSKVASPSSGRPGTTPGSLGGGGGGNEDEEVLLANGAANSKSSKNLMSPNSKSRPTTSGGSKTPAAPEVEEEEGLKQMQAGGDADETYEDKEVRFFNEENGEGVKSPPKSRGRTAPKSRGATAGASGEGGAEEGLTGTEPEEAQPAGSGTKSRPKTAPKVEDGEEVAEELPASGSKSRPKTAPKVEEEEEISETPAANGSKSRPKTAPKVADDEEGAEPSGAKSRPKTAKEEEASGAKSRPKTAPKEEEAATTDAEAEAEKTSVKSRPVTSGDDAPTTPGRKSQPMSKKASQGDLLPPLPTEETA